MQAGDPMVWCPSMHMCWDTYVPHLNLSQRKLPSSAHEEHHIFMMTVYTVCVHVLGYKVPMGGLLVGGGCGDVRTKMVQMESMLSMQTAGCTAGNTSRHLTIVWGNLKQLHDLAGG